MSAWDVFKTDSITLYINEKDQKIIEITPDKPKGVTLTQTPYTNKLKKQFKEYFEKKRSDFDIATKIDGTPFQKSVWNELQQIPYGETRTYGEIAKRLDKPSAYRAVGNAVGKNKLLILIPCHRVVATHGLGGFRAGTPMKEKLLALEKRRP